MLSHAGRLVLINSVLVTLPVYFMSFEVIPKGILKKLNSLLAKFFWGKIGQERYMALISWKKVCVPIEKGGLGVKDIQCFGEALFQKVVWTLMSNDRTMWAQVVKAKYYPRIGFWNAKSNSSASPMWKQVNKLKQRFKEDVGWCIGDGQGVSAIAQPWFRGWEAMRQYTHLDAQKKVANLFDFANNHWKIEELQELFNQEQVKAIMEDASKPSVEMAVSDKLVWKHTNSGAYTVKEGYKQLVRNNPISGKIDGALWARIWGWKNVAPKVRVFMWRLLSKALPISQNMHTRINSFSPTCQRCLEENEYEVHCFFFCQGSRAVWFGSQLGVQTQYLPLDIQEAVMQICTRLDDEQVKFFCYTMWELWKERNETVLNKKSFQPKAVLQRVKGWLEPIDNTPHVAIQRRQMRREERFIVSREGWQIIMDGSWDGTQAAGTAHLIYKGGKLMAMGMQSHKLQDPFLTETVALKLAIKHTKELVDTDEAQSFHFFTDCANLVCAIEENEVQNLPSWRASGELLQIAADMSYWGSAAKVIHIQREGVQAAHSLANHARTGSTNYQGVPHNTIWPMLHHSMFLDDQFFQQVQEAPP
ncbi:RNA-directed DNA polymerase (reverse transcriptase)-related family protein [Rhynchospora pubera]|uniref:RNA-directed DNA polymerase (Reverse transcriptase)-related family protein n=1 Tax=Rhynchospora pubera TaxID=906938 RepID=A0AAV8CR01_9POAL|nr:RNA-directed DNA polymerase (reverse transcriptase)-related family protein [Rhynchospora pubera]